MSTSTPFLFAVAGQFVSQLFVIIIFLFLIGLFLFIWITGGAGLWAALEVVKENVNRFFNSWKK